jgi:hypothetical protein
MSPRIFWQRGMNALDVSVASKFRPPWRRCGRLFSKCWYFSTKLHVVTNQKTVILLFTAGEHLSAASNFKLQRSTPTRGTSEEFPSLVDNCHVVGTVHLHTYWPVVRLPATVGKCDTNQRNRQCVFICQLETCCCVSRTRLYLTSRQ